VELNPNYAMAHHWYVIQLFGMGRVQEALAENEKARRLDPFSLPINYFRTAILTQMGQYQQAMEQAEIVAAIGPEDAAHRLRANIYWTQGSVPEAIAEEKAAADFNVRPERHTLYWDEVARTYASSGAQAAFHRAAETEELACTRPAGADVPANLPCDPGMVAMRYHQAGDYEKTLYWLKRGIEANRKSVATQCWVANSLETGYADMRSDPRFQAILKELGLPQ
jgi:tetratricopeptide (TPR) repeat protein